MNNSRQESLGARGRIFNYSAEFRTLLKTYKLFNNLSQIRDRVPSEQGVLKRRKNSKFLTSFGQNFP